MVTDHVDKELAVAENKKKSKRPASNTDIVVRETKRAKVIDAGSVEPTASNGFSNPQSANGHSTAADTVLAQPGTEGFPVHVSATDVIYSVNGGSAAGLDNFDYMAPVNMVINLPPAVHPAWPGWMWDANIMGSTSGEVDFFSNGDDGAYALEK